FRAIFSPSLAQPGSIDIETPDHHRLVGHPLCLLLTEGNQSVTIAEIKDCAGEVIGPNQDTLLFRDAFTDFNIDLQYRVRKNGVSQWLVLHESIDPRDYGMTDAAVLELLTEWTTLPAVRRRAREWTPATAVQSALIDERIAVGAMEFVTGKAFSIGSPDNGVAVAKTLETFEGNRVCLVEKVPVKLIRPELQKLPKPQAAVRQNRGGQMAVKRGTNLPLLRQAAIKPRPIRMAAVPAPVEPAFVLDFELATSVSSLNWRADSTYYISGPIAVVTNVFEGGCVIKIAPTNSAKLTITGPITCYTTAYKPVVVTGRDDASIGELITTNDLSGSYYADTALELDYNTSGLIYTLENFRLSHAQTAVKVNGGYGHSLNHFQIVHAATAASIQSADVSFRNTLAYDVATAFSGSGANSATGRLENVTVTLSTNFNFGGNSTLFLTNSLLVGVTNIGSYSGNNNAENSDPAGIFDRIGAGYGYLASTNTVWRTAGTTNINASLLAELRKRTTFAPMLLTNRFTQNTNLSRIISLDTNGTTLGYHYPAADFFSSFTVTNATATLTNGVVLLAFGSAGITLHDNSTLISEGTPLLTNRNHIARFNVIQEQSTNCGGGSVVSNISVKAYAYGANAPVAKFRFTDFDTLSQGGFHFYAESNSFRFATLSLRDCEFNSGAAIFGGSESSKVGLTNNLFYRVDSDLLYYPQVVARNNLWYGGSLYADRLTVGNTWTIKDNSFDLTTVSQGSGTIDHGYNAYINASGTFTSTNATDLGLTTLTYETGSLSRFYQPTNSVLIDRGSTNAAVAGLYHHTTTTNSTREGSGTLDIGFHLIALDAFGQPVDSDYDGKPDYLVDPSGNGIVEPNEVNNLKLWLRADLGVTTNGSGYISTWADQSGTGSDAVQSTANLKPLLTTNVLNGLPVASFYTTNYFTFSASPFSGATQAEMVIVLKARAGSPSNWRCLANFGNEGTYYPSPSGNIFDAFGSTTLRDMGVPSQALDQFNVYSAASSSSEWAARLNGVLQCRATNNTVSFPGSPTLGVRTSFYFDGDISELLVYNRVLSRQEREALGNYLAAKYALLAAPPAPTNLVAQAISSNQVSLSWGAPLTNSGTSFVLERKTSGGAYAIIALLDNAASYIDTGLVAGTQYFYRVKARNYAGDSAYSNEADATTLTDTVSMPLNELVLWLKADSGHAAVKLNTWSDQSGRGNHAIQITSASRPDVVNAVVNGRPVVRFDAVNDYLSFQNNFASGMTQAEMFVVVKAAVEVPITWRCLANFGSDGTYYPSPAGNIVDVFGTQTIRDMGDPSQPLNQFNIYDAATSSSEWAA
ncbi:MAG TPA: fibronectin type III domain-containing protein, partial [Candidatus Binatia bacterium]|nr:fibronectin type III domain-containing protein [Candidatus Binatia bacterium]